MTPLGLGRWPILASLLALLLISACGSGDDSAPPAPVARDFVYVTNEQSATISVYAVNPTTGLLTLVENKTGPGSPRSVAAHPGGKFIYVTDVGSSSRILGYAVVPQTGALTSIQEVPAFATQVAIDPGGALAFAGGFRGSGIVSFRLDTGSGLLSSGASTGGEPDISAAIFPDPLSRFVYVLWAVSGPFGMNPHLDTYKVNPVSGAFTLASTSATAFPYPIVLHPRGAFAYGANSQGGDQLYGFTVDGTTGALTQIQTLTVASSFSLAVHPSGTYLYHGQSNNDLAVYTINPTTGQLTFKAAVTLPATSRQIAITPTGSFMYVVLNGNQVAVLSIDPATGIPALLGTIGAGSGANAIAVLRTVS